MKYTSTYIYDIYRTDREMTLNQRSRGGGVLLAINERLFALEYQLANRYLVEAIAISLSYRSVPIFDLIAVYSPSYLKQAQSSELMTILYGIKKSKKTTNTILVGDFNCSAVKWEFDYSNASPSSELLPVTTETETDLIFVIKIIERGFAQKNHLPNNQNIFLDLIFADCDIDCLIQRAEDNILLDWTTHHHSNQHQSCTNRR